MKLKFIAAIVFTLCAFQLSAAEPEFGEVIETHSGVDETGEACSVSVSAQSATLHTLKLHTRWGEFPFYNLTINEGGVFEREVHEQTFVNEDGTWQAIIGGAIFPYPRMMPTTLKLQFANDDWAGVEWTWETNIFGMIKTGSGVYTCAFE